MNTRTLLLLASMATAAITTFAQPEPSKDLLIGSAPSVMDDPEWQKRFLGSYGFLPALEPKVNQDEVVVLGELIEQMKADPSAAALQLSGKITEGSSPALIFILGNLYFQQGQLEEAQKYYLMAVEKHPDFRRAHKNLGLLYLQGQDFANARKHLSRAVELGEYDGRTHGLMAYAYLTQEDYLAAEESYRDAIQSEPEVTDWKLGLARTLLATERYNEAISLLNTLLKDSPSDSTLWLLQANAYLGIGQAMDAAVNLEAVRAMGSPKRESLLLLGDIYLNLEMSEAALEIYQEAIGGDETGAGYPAAFRAAKLLYQTGASKESGLLLDEIQGHYADSMTNDQQLELLTLQAKVARQNGENEKAVALLEDIVSKDGTQGEALIELADYYSKNGDLQTAIMKIELAQGQEKFEYQALVKHAQMLAAERDYEGATRLLERAITIKKEVRVERFLAQVKRASKS